MTPATSEKTCVIMPAFNEEDSIGSVIREIRNQLPAVTVVVINDGSTDQTAAIALQAGANVLNLPFNLGIGGAVQLGLRYALREGYSYAIEVDADGQHDPSYIAELLDQAQRTGADLIIGSRFKASTLYRSSILRRFGIHTFSWLIKLVTKRRVYDSTSGFRVYNRAAINFLHDRYPTDFPEPESIVMLLANGFVIIEIPVEMQNRRHGSSVVGHDLSWRSFYFVISNAIAIIMTGLKPKQI